MRSARNRAIRWLNVCSGYCNFEFQCWKSVCPSIGDCACANVQFTLFILFFTCGSLSVCPFSSAADCSESTHSSKKSKPQTEIRLAFDTLGWWRCRKFEWSFFVRGLFFFLCFCISYIHVRHLPRNTWIAFSWVRCYGSVTRLFCVSIVESECNVTPLITLNHAWNDYS